PLNLTGILTPGERIPALARNRILYEDGVPVLALEAGRTRTLAPLEPGRIHALSRALIRRELTPALRARLAVAGGPAAAARLRREPRRKRPGPAAATSGPPVPEP